MKNNPITQRVKSKFAQLVQEPYLNVGKVQGGKKDSDCGCPSTPAKAYMSSASKPSTVTKASLFGGKIAEGMNKLGMSEEDAKAYAIEEVQKAPKGVGKQTTGDVEIRDVPRVVADKVSDVATNTVEKAKNLVNKIGNINISTEKGQQRRAERKKKRLEKKADKKYETYVKIFDKAEDLEPSAAPKNYKKEYYGK